MSHDDKCKNCGACKHCGAPKGYPYYVGWPVPTHPWVGQPITGPYRGPQWINPTYTTTHTNQAGPSINGGTIQSWNFGANGYAA